jgi:ABC-type nitrate/sulfonate/bicarbonate transport system ATPase subunit
VLGNAILSADLSAESMHEAKQQALRLIPVFGLSGYENYLPADLSGGMRQRVALLRTVMQKRCFLLLDEPLGALDALTRRQMQQWLLEVKSELGLTVLMTTHDIDEASYLSDIVYVLSPRPARSVLRLEPSLAGRTESNKLIARALGLRD